MTTTDIIILFQKIKRELKLKLSLGFDFILFKFNAKFYSPYQSKKVRLYLGENFPPRIPRMIKWLKREADFNAILICHENGFTKQFSNDTIDEVVLYRNEWHLKRILKSFENIELIHAFGPKSFYPDIARQFLPAIKFIYDMQDVLVIYYGKDVAIPWYQKEFPHEQNCLQLSDGLVSHGLEPIPATKIYGFKPQNKRLFFPLFCDDDVFQNRQKDWSMENISVVYAGEIQGASRDKKQFGNVQFFELIETLSAQKIHFHIYPVPSSYVIFGHEYEAIAKVNPYFHIHQSVPQSQLSSELSKYHFGIIPFFKENTNLSDDKNHYSTSLKLFNFIEAGIPIIVSKEIGFQHWMATRYGAGIGVYKKDLSNLRQIFEGLDYPKMVSNLIEQRNKLALSRNIHRLDQFYNKIIQSKNNV